MTEIKLDDELGVLNLKNSEKDKTKEWYESILEHYIPNNNSSIEGYGEKKAVYEFMNNDLSSYKAQIDTFCNPLATDLVVEVKEELYPFNRLYSKTQGMLGELLKRNDDFQLVLHSEDIHEQENEQYREALRASLEEKIMREMEKIKSKGLPEKELKENLEALTTQPEPEEISSANWKSDWKIFYDHVLRYCKYKEEVKIKQQETMKDSLYVDQCFLYVGWKNGRPCIEVCNTLFTGFHKSPNVRYIQKGDYAWTKEAITVVDAMTEYKDKLSKDDLIKLRSYSTAYRNKVDKRHALNGEYISSSPATEFFRESIGGDIYSDKRVGNYQGTNSIAEYDNQALLWKIHFEFKAFKKVIFLSTTDEYNKIITQLVEPSFEIPKDANKVEFVNRFGDDSIRYEWNEFDQDYTAEILWIPRRYEVTKLGDIYLDYREVPNQPDNIENPYSDFELSYKGVIYNARNAKSLSAIQRAIPSQLQAYYIKHIQNRELAKYQGFIQDVDVDQIPLLLGQDENGEVVKDHVVTWLKIKRQTNMNLFSGSQNSLGGLPPSTRSPGSRGYMVGTAMELINLQNLADLVDREMGLMFGYTPEREGEFTRGSNASDNRQSITQSHHTTEPLYFLHSLIWKSAYQDYLKLFRRYCEMTFELYPEREYLTFTYYFNDSEHLFKVTPKMLQHVDLGIHLNNTGQSQRYMDTMYQMIQPIAQNAGEGAEMISTLLKAITSEASPEEVHRMIEVAGEKQRRRAEQMEQARLKAQEDMLARQLQVTEDAQQHEKDKISLKGELDKDKMVTQETMKALAWNEDKDFDNDGQLDIIEIRNSELKKEELDLKRKELEHKMQVDKEEVAIKKQQSKK